MSERYGKCSTCKGHGVMDNLEEGTFNECMICLGTGMSGDSTDYIREEIRFEHERDLIDNFNYKTRSGAW